MSKYAKIFLVLIAVSLLSPAHLAGKEDISVTASTNKNEVAVGEIFKLTVSLSGNIKGKPEIEPPDLSNFEVLSSSQSQNISIKGSVIDFKVGFVYLLRATEEGNFTIGEFAVSFAGKTYKTEPLKIVVDASREPKTMPLPKLPPSPKKTPEKKPLQITL